MQKTIFPTVLLPLSFSPAITQSLCKVNSASLSMPIFFSLSLIILSTDSAYSCASLSFCSAYLFVIHCFQPGFYAALNGSMGWIASLRSQRQRKNSHDDVKTCNDK